MRAVFMPVTSEKLDKSMNGLLMAVAGSHTAEEWPYGSAEITLLAISAVSLFLRLWFTLL